MKGKNNLKEHGHASARILKVLGSLLAFVWQPQSALAQGEWATNGNDIYNTNPGNVGIGTSAPSGRFQINEGAQPLWRGLFTFTGSVLAMKEQNPDSTRYPYIAWFDSSQTRAGYLGWGSSVANGFNPKYLELGLDNSHAFGITGRNMGVGTVAPATKLHVADNGAQPGASTGNAGGTRRLSGRLYLEGGYTNLDFTNSNTVHPIARIGLQNTGGGSFPHFGTSNNDSIGVTDAAMTIDPNGNVSVAGNIAAKYQDLGEWVPAGERIPAGTVVVVDPDARNEVTRSSQPYDTRVAGVVSRAPGILLGEAGEGKVMVATTGR